MGKGGVGTSRSEFLSEDTVDDIRYHRNGGCFVTTKRAIVFVLFAITSLLAVIVLMYYYGPNRQLEGLQEDTKDIEALINKTINEEPKENIRLPLNIKPIHYQLKIHPILNENTPNNFTFTGQVKILIKCLTKTNKIILNMEFLNIKKHDVTVTTRKPHLVAEALIQEEEGGEQEEKDNKSKESKEIETKMEINNNKTVTNNNDSNSSAQSSDVLVKSETANLHIQEISQEEGSEKFIIVLANLLEPGHNYTVDIKFAGNITNNLVGLYKTSYTDADGSKRWLATTYLNPVFARRVFPCFDEPNFKATFEISIARRANMTALTNMPLRHTENMTLDGNNTDDDAYWVWDHFEKSLPMSTYLLSFTICDFKNIGNGLSKSTPIINVWAPESDLERTKYALETTQNVLKFLENYLAIKYPLTKIDIIAIPNYPRETMGSWGILSFRKSSILLDKASRSYEIKQGVFIRLVHELAHQWFGNLVTMRWWSDYWLNEGIGSFMAEAVQKTLRPKWQTSEDFPLRVMYKSFKLDSLKSTSGIQSEVTKITQIEQLADTVIQSKATCLIRMLNYTLSKPVFQQGLQYYLSTLSYKSSDQDTLWEYLNKIANNNSVLPDDVTVKDFMNSWTKQKGYPYVTIIRDYQNGEAVITQKIFIQDNINNDSLWYIPLSYTSTDDVIKTIWMKGVRNVTLNISAPGWVLFNIDQAGYFRVNYDKKNWHLLIEQLHKNPNEIPVASRSQLLDDAYELAKMNIINYTIPLELTNYLNEKETNYIPWFAALNSLDELRFIISNYEYTAAFETFLINLIRQRFHSLGTKEKPDEHRNDKILRWRLLQIACELRYEPCIRWAKEEFTAWMLQANPDDVNPIPFEIRQTVECMAIKTGNRDEWEFLWNRTQSNFVSSGDLKTIYLSLGCTNDPWLINRYLELSLNGNITIEYIPYVWQSFNHPVGIRTGFHFLRLNWERIYNTYEDVYLVLNSICQHFLTHLSTEIDLEDLTQFFKKNKEDLKSVATLIQASVDIIKLRIDWKEKYFDSVVDWLKNDNYKYKKSVLFL